MATTYYGTRHTTSNKPIKTCAEMKGLKIRVPDVPAYLAMPRACGANTAPIAFAEVYLALQNGTVEAQENPLTTIEAKKFYEVQKHIVLTGHIVDHLNTVVAKAAWAKLAAEEQKIFIEVARRRRRARPPRSRPTKRSWCSSSRTRASPSPRSTATTSRDASARTSRSSSSAIARPTRTHPGGEVLSRHRTAR